MTIEPGTRVKVKATGNTGTVKYVVSKRLVEVKLDDRREISNYYINALEPCACFNCPDK